MHRRSVGPSRPRLGRLVVRHALASSDRARSFGFTTGSGCSHHAASGRAAHGQKSRTEAENRSALTLGVRRPMSCSVVPEREHGVVPFHRLRLCRILFGLLVFLSAAANAQEQFLRVTCVPETGYLLIEFKALESEEEYVPGRGDKEWAGVWKRHGFLDVRGLKHECRLKQSIYRLSTAHVESRHGGTCNIALTLLWNDETWLDRVMIGPRCGSGEGSFLEHVEIWDGIRSAQKPSSMTLCFRRSLDAVPVVPCESFMPHPTQRDVLTLTQESLEEYFDARER